MPKKYFYGVGRRKSSVAQVRLYEDGEKNGVTVNEKPFEQRFPVSVLRDAILAPLRMTGTVEKFFVSALVNGGGMTGQAEAIRHGMARALTLFDPSLRVTLKKAGFLTRDPREKERKKPGLKRARRAPQWSKR